MVVQRTRDYELVMVLNPEIPEEEHGTTIERVTEFITDRGGSIVDRETWGVRRLAYPIQRFREGFYTLTRFTLDAPKVSELERSLIASEDVMRHLIMKADRPAAKGPAAKDLPAG